MLQVAASGGVSLLGWAVVVVAALTSAGARAAPSVGVLPLTHQGLDTSASVVEEQLVGALVDAQVFGRVLPPRELGPFVPAAQAAQLASCTDPACVWKVSGVLGGDFALLDVQLLLTGTLSRAGSAWVLSLKLLNLQTGITQAAVSRTICGPEDPQLAGSVGAAARALLFSAHLLEQAKVAPLSVQCGGGVAAAEPAAAPVSTGRRGPHPSIAVLGVGGVFAVAGVLLAAGGMAGLGALTRGAVVAALPTPGLTRTPRFVALRVPPTGMLVASAVTVLLATASWIAGGALLAIGGRDGA